MIGDPPQPEPLRGKSNEEIKQEYLRDFLAYRNDYINEIPRERVPQNDPRLDFYKCRAHFFLRILSRVLQLVSYKILTDPKVVAQCKAFKVYIEKMDKEKFQPDKPTTREDIDEANKFLDYMILELQK